MEAKFPRTYVDLNRSHLELDPNLISGDFILKYCKKHCWSGCNTRFSGSGKATIIKLFLLIMLS